MAEPSEPNEEQREWLRDGGCIDNAEGVRYLISWLARGKALLAKHGLHLVNDADKRVLDAMAKAEIRQLENGHVSIRVGGRDVCLAELARRGEKA